MKTSESLDVQDAEAVEFIARRQVRFSDCDPAGIVFFPNYFRMLNGVVEDWWAHLGKPWTELVTVRRIGTPTFRLDTEFVQPSKFGELLDFHLTVEKLGNTSLVLHHVVIGADTARMRARQVLVATSLDTHKAIPWPDDVRQAIQRFMEKQS
ncbi:4-hydroxybenzoyl-CoA thioesterase [Parazoarcus communis]|uniref:4-hydroxybenzoyl-CoA thioesterase n=1 Tax=Parazoarcus communis TaxID=41977 RepID=A0A2U8GLH3_9RHOO|nr:thioesterase family protein [Parazoarcus communis]AWI74457.1 4-hydroxybenzoyl-CoA thioesterase [Parazoarcus communis]